MDIPSKAAQALQEALKSAPAFVNLPTDGNPAQPSSSQGLSGSTGTVQTSTGGSNPGPGKQPCNAQQLGNNSPGASAPAPACQIGRVLQSSEPRHVFLCVKRGSSHHFSDIETHTMRCDAHFFAALKENYFRLRGRLRRYFSMWQYDRCEFYQVSFYHSLHSRSPALCEN